MKNTIQITEHVYFYENKAELVKSETGDLAWSNILQIVEKGNENNPLAIHFLAKDDYYMGNTMLVEMVDGIKFDNQELIQKLVLFGQQKGWKPSKKGMKIGDGMNVLRALGYNVDTIDAAHERNIHEFLIKK